MTAVSVRTSRISVKGTRGKYFHRFEPRPHSAFRFAGRRAAARARVAARRASVWRRVMKDRNAHSIVKMWPRAAYAAKADHTKRWSAPRASTQVSGTTSEHETQAELQLAWRGTAGERRDLACVRVADRHAGQNVPILHVEHIERFEAQLYVPSLAQRKTLEHGHIHVEHRRPAEDGAPEVPERSGRNRKRARVEPRRGVPDDIGRLAALRLGCVAACIWIRSYGSSHERIGDDVGPGVGANVGRASSEVGNIAVHLQVIRLARPRLHDVVQLPVAEQPRCRSALEPALPAARGKLVENGPGQEVRNVVAGHTSGGALVVVVLNR